MRERGREREARTGSYTRKYNISCSCDSDNSDYSRGVVLYLHLRRVGEATVSAQDESLPHVGPDTSP